MALKRKLLIGLFAAIACTAVVDAKNPFSSGVVALDEIEMSAMLESNQANQDILIEKMNSAQMQHLVGRVMGKVMILSLLFNQKYASLSAVIEQAHYDDCNDEDRAEMSGICNIVSSLLKGDTELTSLIINPVCFMCEQAEKLIHQSPGIIDNLSVTNVEELQELFAEYLPHVDVDVFDCYVSYCIWGRLYLKQKLEETGVVTTADCFDVARDLVVHLQLPEKAQELWGGLLSALEKGYEGLAQEIQQVINDACVEFLKDPKQDEYIASMESLLQMRHALIDESTHKDLSDQDLKLYKFKLVTLIEQANQLNSNMFTKYAALPEKMIFKN